MPELRYGPRTEPEPEWEARRRAHEAAFWAVHLLKFEQSLPRIRKHRGDELAGRLVADVIGEVGARLGPQAAALERGLLMQRWREQGGA